jgi:hypothetical protein
VTQGRGLSAQDAESFEEADAAFKNGDFATAQRLLVPLVDKGDHGSQVLLGMMYYDGKGVP